MEFHLAGQTAVVVGGHQGIGLAIARAFAGEGCSVAILDRDPGAPAAAAGISGEFGGRTLGIVCDVTGEPAVMAAAARIGDEFGPVHHVVFAAGVGSGKFGFPFWNLSPDDWLRVFAVNLFGAVNVAHAFAPMLIAAGRGSLLFLGSVAGQIGSQTDPPYSASKAAIVNFMQCAAKDLAPHNIRVNALSPGMVKTKLNESVWAAGQQLVPENERESYDDWAAKKMAKLAPMGRWQTPAEFGAMAVFLASDHARNITGQTLNIDGGQVMHS